MHMMCVIGVYVTDPAHNIIFGGNCSSFFGVFLDRRFSMFFYVLHFLVVAIMSGRLGGVWFGVFRCFLFLFLRYGHRLFLMLVFCCLSMVVFFVIF